MEQTRKAEIELKLQQIEKHQDGIKELITGIRSLLNTSSPQTIIPPSPQHSTSGMSVGGQSGTSQGSGGRNAEDKGKCGTCGSGCNTNMCNCNKFKHGCNSNCGCSKCENPHGPKG
jgi:hypothetical protein